MDEQQRGEKKPNYSSEKDIIQRIMAADNLQLNPERRKMLGYEAEDVIAYYSKQSLNSQDTYLQVEALLRRSNKLNIIISADNKSNANFKYMKIASKFGHAFKVVADEQFTGDTGLVIVKG
ncbi:DUF1694 domain-containing protein [Desulfuribacillus alkaliarsenatis]|uniref:DUF1694 domain-containing protein n=1 Tax=Desulfuribacillus alkaliarsenatis TaxID=766136 RepID=A0A1E5G485_9FIRM|nr:DUF1694 domain-containing protein [Desulfuribacillus alkaliarsenatis]OEF97898.1 hypothetical protein BHF68_12555 [Desulfuribacillus alkaliarsenatis]